MDPAGTNGSDGGDAVKGLNVGLLGLGTVGAGVVNLLTRNAEEISRRSGSRIRVVAAVMRHPERPRACPTSAIRLGTRGEDIVNDPGIDVVVELLGGLEPARSLVLAALEQGKHVVTANKALIAVHGNALFARARECGVSIRYEAAVAGGIPIIKAMREGLTGNRIEWVAGIINGTTNYILSEMQQHGREFADVLAEAQRLGYAEADPSFDIDGIDAAHKLTILASIAFGIPLQFEHVHAEGISHVAREDVAYAEALGYRIKHLGLCRWTETGPQLRVHPTLLPKSQLLASVDGVMNAVMVMGDAVGPTLYYGAGAGAEPTASAVVADLVDVVRSGQLPIGSQVPHLAFQDEALSDRPALPMDLVETACYLRLDVVDEPGVLADVTRILSDHGISIESMLQKEPAAGAETVPVILLTHRVLERNMDAAIAAMQTLSAVRERIVRIRLETLR